MRNWKTVKLGKVCEVVRGGSPRPIIDFVTTSPYGVNWLKIGDVNEHDKYLTHSAERIIKAGTAKSRAVKKGDLILSNSMSFGRVFITLIDGCIHDGWLRLRNNENLLDREYLYYFLSSKFAQNQFKAIATGSVVNNLKSDTVKNIDIDLPSLDEQRAIASILCLLDDKIAINEKINNHLEQIAQAVFKKEFVSLSSLPIGWQQASLIDIADYLNGLAMQKYRPTDDERGIPVLKIKELRQGGCDNNSELCSPNIKSEYIIQNGDVIFSWSGSLLIDFWCDGICGLNQHLFKVSSKKYDKWFYYAWIKHYLNHFIAVAADKATTMGHIKRDELIKTEVFIPTEEDYNRIGSLLNPIYDLIISNRIENNQLAKTRNSLLPRLISGELDISEI